MKKFIALILILLIGWTVIWYLCLNRKQTPHQKEHLNLPQVYAKQLTPQPITLTHEYIGHIEAIHSVQVYPYIAGFIEQVLVPVTLFPARTWFNCIRVQSILASLWYGPFLSVALALVRHNSVWTRIGTFAP